MLPKRALNENDLLKYSENIPNFRGVYMRDNLPKKAWKFECGIINLDNLLGSGTHWVAYFKNKKYIEYFDSFGNLRPPQEIVKYLGNKINYNYDSYQKYNSINCGHLCLRFLTKICKEKMI